MPFQVIPAVDVLGGNVVRLFQGDYRRVTVYQDDPVACARGWVDQGADLVHVVDLEAARTGGSSRRLWEALATAGVPFQAGGGLRTAGSARDALELGARRVVMGTAAVWEPQVLAEVGDPQRVVAAVDVRSGRATGTGWTDRGRDLATVLDDLATAGIRRILVTGVGRDGTMSGPDVGLLGDVVSDGRFRIVASGGVGSLDDLHRIASLGCEAAIVGRALYEGRFRLADALSV